MVPLLLILVVLEIGISFFGPLLPQIQREFGLSAGRVAVALAIYNGVRLLFNLPLSRFIARAPLPSMLAAGSAILAIGGLVAGLAPSFPVVIIGRAIMGMGSAMFILVVHFWLARAATPENKARLFSYHQVVGITGSALGPAIGGAVAGWLSWRHAHALAVLAGLIAVIAGWRLPYPAARTGVGDAVRPIELSPDPAPDSGRRVPFREILGPATAMLGFIFFHGGVISTLIPLFAAREVGFGPAAIGLVLMLGTLQRFGSALLGGRLVSWFGTRRVVVVGLAALALSVLSFLAVDSSLGLILAVSLISWANLGGSFVIAMVTDRVPESHWATALGVNRMMGDIGGLVAPILVGLVIDHAGFNVAIIVAAGIVLAAAGGAGALTAMRPTRREPVAKGGVPREV